MLKVSNWKVSRGVVVFPEVPVLGPPTSDRDLSRRGAEEKRGGLTCLEWDLGSGGLKKESGSFLILMGTDWGTTAPFGFITALNSASRSVSESPRTCTIWCPAGGLCWLGSIVPQALCELFAARKRWVTKLLKGEPTQIFFNFFFFQLYNL